MNLQSFRAYIVISILLLVLAQLSFRAAGLDLFPEGPAWQITQSAREVVEIQRMDSPRLSSMKDLLQAQSARDRSRIWQDIFAITADGRVVPKHCQLLSLSLAPFYLVFGDFGFILATQLMSLAILVSLFKLTERLFRPCPGLILLVLVFGLTQFLLYTDIVDIDLFGSFCIVVGLVLAFTYPLLGSWLMGMSVFVRPTFFLFAPILLWPVVRENRSWNAIIRVMLGVGTAFGLFLAQNWALWGHPFTTVYHRFPGFLNGQVHYQGDQRSFGLDILFSRWWDKFFDYQIGLLFYNPIFFVFLLMLIFQKWKNFTTLSTSIIVYVLTSALLIFSYSGWVTSPAGGNRYLLSGVLLLSAVVCSMIARVMVSRDRTASSDLESSVESTSV